MAYKINRKWKHKIEMDLRDKGAEEVATLLAVELRRLPEEFRGSGPPCIPDTLDDLIPYLDDISKIHESERVDAVDEVLRNIYDWADNQDLWLYLRFS